jgi:hypothetical protein
VDLYINSHITGSVVNTLGLTGARMLMVLASTVVLGFGPHETQDSGRLWKPSDSVLIDG